MGKNDNKILLERDQYGLRPYTFYLKCMLGGVLACGVTHASVVTLDVAKCRSQAHSKSGKWPSGLVPSLRKIIVEEGLAGMRVGWVPTFFGYGAQGLFKFGLNEVFKDIYGNMIGGEENIESKAAKMLLWAAASGSAEIFADIALCPFEMTKVKMQVTLPGDANALPRSLIPAMRHMASTSVESKFPFGSLMPLWGRQVPYTMIKFVGFYLTADFVYDQLLKRKGLEKKDIKPATQLAITFACGYWAGIFCAVATQVCIYSSSIENTVSAFFLKSSLLICFDWNDITIITGNLTFKPMDNLVSMKGIPEYKTKTWGQMAKDMGIKNLFLRGLATRVIMIGTLTGLQWWIYGSFKNLMGFGTS
eukprot:TRINITY_DN2131_c0_g4_i1.p1 TRINITY_DN2131_c0_g4~~TRINITY_DN2131_c0_g4_i1.p1  ORF type:complete len:362 (-),score=45.91 TRINITY_DN2131_c0_g4_i1:19-1104(-)